MPDKEGADDSTDVTIRCLMGKSEGERATSAGKGPKAREGFAGGREAASKTRDRQDGWMANSSSFYSPVLFPGESMTCQCLRLATTHKETKSRREKKPARIGSNGQRERKKERGRTMVQPMPWPANRTLTTFTEDPFSAESLQLWLDGASPKSWDQQ